MQLQLGTKIRELRRRDGRTQENLADALGVTPQAVSRWESGGSYPDMEIIPAIANYFGITIDELFGYHNDRERKVDAILDRIGAFGIKSRGDDLWVDECVQILREGLAEFPKNERLLMALADTLSEAGWRKHQEWLYYDDEGFIRHDYDRHRKNEYWSEAVRICEQLADHSADGRIVTKAVGILVLLYRNFGEYEKAASFARRMPEMKNCRELLLAGAADGKKEAEYVGDFLLKAARAFAEQLVYGLIVNGHHYESDMPIEKVKGAIAVFDLICDDGNMGPYHDDLIKLYLYLSRLQWERGYHDDAFLSLDKALDHARALEKLFDGESHRFTAPLVSFVEFRLGGPKRIAVHLPGDWPFWCNPDCTEAAAEIKADPRWAEWISRTQE
ncbi:MAG: helix-turn-helix transcriptional regulator [Oscillospiraceae bacterium]|nr:helix-turn-helix transcriptional regulator [Oscillospiraceae bacterium]